MPATWTLTEDSRTAWEMANTHNLQGEGERGNIRGVKVASVSQPQEFTTLADLYAGVTLVEQADAS